MPRARATRAESHPWASSGRRRQRWARAGPPLGTALGSMRLRRPTAPGRVFTGVADGVEIDVVGIAPAHHLRCERNADVAVRVLERLHDLRGHAIRWVQRALRDDPAVQPPDQLGRRRSAGRRRSCRSERTRSTSRPGITRFGLLPSRMSRPSISPYRAKCSRMTVVIDDGAKRRLEDDRAGCCPAGASLQVLGDAGQRLEERPVIWGESALVRLHAYEDDVRIADGRRSRSSRSAARVRPSPRRRGRARARLLRSAIGRR